MKRRRFLQRVIALTTAVIASLIRFRVGNAAETPINPELTKHFQQAYADQIITDSPEILINLPTNAENGAVVPITIQSQLDNIDSVYIWAEKNPTPLVAEFELAKDVAIHITARIKLAENSHVIVIARQGQHLLRNLQWVNVMQGGCGTG
jgi:sulfur-oxidizing protein SoxY